MTAISTVTRYPKISKIIYNDSTYYYGEENKGNQLKNGYGKLCNPDCTIILAGYWQDDECIESMTEAEIEDILSELY